MKLDISGFRDKDSAKPEYRELYETLPFIEAYAKHTDMRIAKDGPELAIGAKRDGQQDWDKHGKMQLDFLIAKGFRPHHWLLDIGCGTGRLASQVIPYISTEGEYVGVDISESAIAHCQKTLGNTDKGVTFAHRPDGRINCGDPIYFHFIWAHSVATHLPPQNISQLFSDLTEYDHGFGQFFFTYKAALQNQRSGLKQFQYSPAWLIKEALRFGLKAETDPMEWPAGQRTMRVIRD